MTTPAREFNFLPDLPKANLDDRTFDDLVQECMLRIPRYCPEWTNHNPGDPGMTLLELFAWLTDQMLMRFNQVPRRNYVAFLELLGIRLQPPTAAQADLNFYLSKSQSAPIVIPAHTEVATVRTETEPAVVFTTDRELVIGQPQIRGLFTALRPQEQPEPHQFIEQRRDGSGAAQFDQLGEGEGLQLFADREIGNCFYLVLAPAQAPEFAAENQTAQVDSITGNAIALTFQGRIAETTGILPDDPPLRWEVWNGETWQPGILRQRQDDKTKGFSFQQADRIVNPVNSQANAQSNGQSRSQSDQGEADVILHLPQQLPIEDFETGCRGHWLRCVYIEPADPINEYLYSPSITRVSVRSIGGQVSATECIRLQDELLGVSNGKPGQTFQLEGRPVLAREPDEQIWLRLPDGNIEAWQEVTDFGNSGANDPHYLIDSQAGLVQFGPLVREPSQLRDVTQVRSQLQSWGKQTRRSDTLLPMHHERSPDQRWQYGRVPPLGAEIYMSAYRVGGGSRGNVQAETLSVMKVSIPYIKRVVNYKPATGGREAESLDEAVLRVPQILRTSQTAVIPEDFENIALRTHPAVYRAHCPPQTEIPGLIKLLIVPKPDGINQPKDTNFQRDFPNGMAPYEHFTLDALSSTVLNQLQAEINQRKSLGLQVRLETPTYVGVKVFAEVLLHAQYATPAMQQTVQARIRSALYRFINPVTGGFAGNGWPLGQALHASDIVAFLQDLPEVSYIGMVKLFGLRQHSEQGWYCSEIPDFIIEPGEWGLLCSWNDPNLQSAHDIQILSRTS